VAVGLWGIQPSEFFRMTLKEWWAIADAKDTGPKPPPRSEADKLRALIHEGF
jgi:hypothetical protein